MDTLVLLGCIAALGSAAAWAVGSLLWRKIGDDVSPLGMNLGKGLLGLVFLGGALAIFGIEPVDTRSLVYLGISGLLGIALGDTFFFMALVRLDPRLTLLLGSVGQVFTVLMAVVFLEESPSATAWVGIVLVIGGVTWVMRERQETDEEEGVRGRRSWGIVWGLLAALCMSAGTICAKKGVADVSALEGTFLRLAVGMAGLALFGAVRRQLGSWLSPFRDPRVLRSILAAVLVIIFGGFWLSLLALKCIDASVAIILMSVEPLFVLPLVAIFRKEKVSLRAILGAFVAVGGVGLIVWSLAEMS